MVSGAALSEYMLQMFSKTQIVLHWLETPHLNVRFDLLACQTSKP